MGVRYVGEETADTVQGFGEGGRHFADREALLAVAGGELGEGDSVLVKGSRSAGMERVLHALVGDPVSGED